MIIRRFLLFSIIAVLIIGATGCLRPASTPPPTPTPQGSPPVPGGTDDMGMFEQFATQTSQAATAQAGGGGGGEGEGGGDGGGQPVATNTPAAQGATSAPDAQQPTHTPKPTKAQVVVPTATPGLPANYTVQKGEFPYCIARRFNINPNQLLQANGLSQNSTIYPGMVLKIPQGAGPFPGDRSLHDHPTTYTVKSGDTIYSVSCYFGDVDPNAIAYANSLKSPYTLTSGKSIQIP